MKTSLLQRFLTLMSITFVSAASAAPQASQPAALPPITTELAALKPTDVLPANVAVAVKLQSSAEVPKPTLTRAGAGAFIVETFSKAERIYAVEAQVPIEKPVKKGDVCLARFAMRALSARQESGEAAVGVYFQQTTTPHTKSANLQLGAGPDWTPYVVPFTVAVDSEPGASALYFAFGNLQQKVEIAGVQVLNFGTSVSMDKLPATRFSYRGREANAEWRAKALERIEQLRTAPIHVIVRDADGKPIEGARVEARLVQPAFAFGTAVESEAIAPETPDTKIYREKTSELFDTVTIGNGLKWQPWMNLQRRANAMKTIAWIESQGMRLRGHALVWPGWKFSPTRLQKLANPAVELPQQIETRIEDGVSAIKGRVWTWDVLNEPVHERDFYQHFPETKSADWFKQARKLDPHALLFVNEYAMLNSSTSPDFIKRYLAFVKMLQDNGAPLDGIGVQGHIGGQVRNPTDVLADLDLLQTAGLPIHITEFDINTKDEELQADYTRDFLIACYSHPAVTGFIMWGFWEKDHWKPDAAMFRADWSEKPNAKVWREWMAKWRTRVDATTDARGEVTARGHLGVYEVTVTKGDLMLKHNLQLTQNRGAIALTLQWRKPGAS